MDPHPTDEFAPDLPRPAVLCTIVKAVGSCPQHVGAKMWVTRDAFHGTLGGGRFEHEVLARARGLLERSGAPHVLEYVLCKESGQCCGGRVEVFFDPMPRRKAVHLFGAGHIGRAAAEVLSGTPLAVTVVDPRPEWAQPSSFPKGVRVIRSEPVEHARSRIWSEDDAICIFTHSHDLDYLLVEFFLRRPVGYLGLIGSRHKAQVFLARLRGGLGPTEAAALDDSWEERVRCPAGLNLPSKNPKVIAVSIAMELLRDWALKASAPVAG